MAIITFPESMRSSGENNHAHVCFSLSDVKNNQFGRIHLYVPSGFSVSDTANYNSVELGAIGNAGMSGSEASNAPATEADTTAAAANAAGNLGPLGNSVVGTAIKNGVAINPFTNVAFTGTSVREFSFSFKLISESAKEAQVARKIENLFRKNLYPEATRIALKYPPQFQITFYNGEDVNPFMPKIMPCFLTGLQTTFNGSSNVYHADGAPAEMEMQLSFQETKALVRSDLYDVEDTAEDSMIPYRQDKAKTNAKVG